MSDNEIKAVLRIREAELFNAAMEVSSTLADKEGVDALINHSKDLAKAIGAWESIRQICNDMYIDCLSQSERLAIGLKH